MKALFNFFTSLSLRFRAVTLLLVVVVLLLGGVAVTQLNQELLPPIEFPQTIILAQATGMTSEQVLNVLTVRLEATLGEIDEIVNLESQTTGAFGAVLTARNEFGVNQERLLSTIEEKVDSVWLPLRRIQPPAGENPAEFARRLLEDLTPDVLIYMAERDSNFLFQLAPEVWAALPEATARETLAYLAAQVAETGGNALQQLVEQELVPQIGSLEIVARVQVSGGQALPGESTVGAAAEVTSQTSLLLQLSPEVWTVVAGKLGLGELDTTAVEALSAVTYTVPEAAPALPSSWQMDRFATVTDLLEVSTLTVNTAGLLNAFYEEGQIVGALGQTDDLTPDDVTRLLEIEPTLVNYFEADQLAALSPEVFAVLPEAYIAGLDGFTRDALAAAALAERISGQAAERPAVNLPAPWRIAPPQLITFSFADLPLATFSVSNSGELESVAATTPPVDEATEATDTPAEQPTSTPTEAPVTQEVPEGPALPLLFSALGGFLGIELNTADDLINLQLPEDMAATFGGDSLPASQLLNFLMLLGDPESLPPGVEMPAIPLNPNAIIGALSPEAVAFLAEYDPTFVSTLSADVFNAFSDNVLAQPQIAPPLADVWSALADQPQFAEMSLVNAADVVRIGDNSPAQVLNTINTAIPEQFAGYEVRLFDSLSPATLRYFALQEADFYTKLDTDVLRKLNPAGLQNIPADVLAGLDSAVASELTAIAEGTQSSAFEQLRERYASDVLPADPAAPLLNSEWGVIGNFIGVELDSADDFSRFYPSTTNFLNDIFNTPAGVGFAPSLFGGLSIDALTYMAAKDPELYNGLTVDALQLLAPEVLAALPQEVQDRAIAGGEPFVPTASVTRADGASSLQVTVYKTRAANTVAAFHAVEEVLKEAQERNPNLEVSVAFEQASFIEESISGVAREGSLGALFAMVVILLFLSGGHWAAGPRRVSGLVMTAIFAVLLGIILATAASGTGGDLGAAFAELPENSVIAVFLLAVALVVGLLIVISPFDLPYPAWRATLVIGVSIPVSVLAAMIVMRWVSPAIHQLLLPAVESSPLIAFLIRLFPEELTLNIMTLSGLTVAIGRVVDDSIVVLENIMRQIQAGLDKREAILTGTRDVSLAIFVATLVTVVVFLPLGLTGGLIGEFFLPFGLAVTYSLLASFIVAISVVPVLVFLFIRKEEAEHEETDTVLERVYAPVLKWTLSGRNGLIVLGAAFLTMIFGFVLFGGRPAAFLPALGEPQIGVTVSLPAGTKIVETNALVEQLEDRVQEIVPDDERDTILTIVGGGGLSLESLLTGGGVSENSASVTIGVSASDDKLDEYTGAIRAAAEEIFGVENVTVSAASISEQGFGGFSVVLSGPPDALAAVNEAVIAAIEAVDGIANVSSNLAAAGDAPGGDGDAPQTYIRIDGETALSYTGELETDNTIGVTQQAIAAVEALPDLPDTIKISQGFETETQVQGFQGLFVAMGIAILIMVVILVFTFGSPVYWLAIILSIVVAPVGAAVALTLTDRVLGISALIGLLMLIGIVVTNAVVLIDRVHTNDTKRKMKVNDALMEAGNRRLRPIVMTALATIMALMPLAIGLSRGAIIASELGTVVIGGLVSSTLLTLIVVPVAYKMLHPLHNTLLRLIGRGQVMEAEPVTGD